MEEFEQLGLAVEIATDDGSRGEAGLVTQLLARFLEQNSVAQAGVTLYACGPLPMLRALWEFAARSGVRCQISLEENMPCGIGVCNGCVVPVQSGADDYERYRRICVDGPVMWSHDIDWS